MAPQHKKNYTNADIIKRLDGMDNRLSVIEVWKVGQEAGKAAVDEYRRQESNNNRNSMFDSIKDVTPYAIALLVALAAVLYAHAGGK